MEGRWRSKVNSTLGIERKEEGRRKEGDEGGARTGNPGNDNT